MSGSGGGSYMPPQYTKFDCENSKIITNVSSINLTVLNKHKIGNRLKIFKENIEGLSDSLSVMFTVPKSGSI